MIDGKTIFNWNVPQIMEGDPQNFAKLLVDAGFEGVCLKAGDGNLVYKMSSYSPWPKWGENIRPELVVALRDAGLKIYLWHFLYGYDILGELHVAFQQCDKIAPDGYIWDVEGQFDTRPGAVSNAVKIAKGFASIHPSIPQALCWWAFPLNPSNPKQMWHPLDVGKAFMDTVDVGMPMMYWGGETITDATSYLGKSLGIWRGFTDKPIIPIGRAYNGQGGNMNSVAIIAFSKKVHELSISENLPGVSWWSLDKVLNNPSCWDALKRTEKFGVSANPVPPPELTDRIKIDRLVEAHPNLFPELN